MTEMTKVAFYYGMKPKGHVIDMLVQPEPPVYWVPALANFQQGNLERLMALANITPSQWRSYLMDKYGFDPINPTAEGLVRAGVPEGMTGPALDYAREAAETWGFYEEPWDMMWACDGDEPSNLGPAQVEEVLAESRGRGTPIIVFQAPEDQVMAALQEDNQVTIKGDRGVYIGLSDPINGYGWSPQHITTPVTFRPSIEGVTILGNHPVFDYVVDDAYTASISYVPGEPLRVSTKTEETMRFGPPVVRDERDEVPAPSF